MIRFTFSPRKAVLALLFFNIGSFLLGNSDLTKGGWDDISEEELAITTPKIEKTADAEFLYRKVEVNDTRDVTLFKYHNRAKIYTEAGVDKWDKVDLLYQTGWRVYSVKARVIYPDGNVVQLDKNDIFERQLFKDESFEGSAKSFSFPDLKPGCIIEYKWTTSRRYWMPSFEVPVRAEWPTWKFDLSVAANKIMASRIVSYNSNFPFEKINGKYVIQILDQPAASTKSYLPPRKNFEPFIYMGYATDLDALTRGEYWAYRGGAVAAINKQFVRAKQKEVKKLAARLFEGLSHGEDKLKVAYDYCANELTNISFYTDRYSEEELEELKENDNPNMTIRNGYGTRYDINAVFASLASAAGFYARMAQVEDKENYRYIQSSLGAFNLSDWVVSIQYGKSWRFFDPGSSFLPFETLNPENVDANAFSTDKELYYMLNTSEIADDYSTSERVANVEIDEFGDLKGTIKVKHTGYESLWRKRLFVSLTDEEQKDYIEENDWISRFPRATIDNLKMEGAALRNNELTCEYSVTIPGYADVLGDRIIISPSLFELGKPKLFPEEKRVEGISFRYKTHIKDKVAMQLPDGYALESSSRHKYDLEHDLLNFNFWAKFDSETDKLYYERDYALKLLLIGAGAYPTIRKIFHHVNNLDSLPLALTAGDI